MKKEEEELYTKKIALVMKEIYLHWVGTCPELYDQPCWEIEWREQVLTTKAKDEEVLKSIRSETRDKAVTYNNQYEYNE